MKLRFHCIDCGECYKAETAEEAERLHEERTYDEEIGMGCYAPIDDEGGEDCLECEGLTEQDGRPRLPVEA